MTAQISEVVSLLRRSKKIDEASTASGQTEVQMTKEHSNDESDSQTKKEIDHERLNHLRHLFSRLSQLQSHVPNLRYADIEAVLEFLEFLEELRTVSDGIHLDEISRQYSDSKKSSAMLNEAFGESIESEPEQITGVSPHNKGVLERLFCNGKKVRCRQLVWKYEHPTVVAEMN